MRSNSLATACAMWGDTRSPAAGRRHASQATAIVARRPRTIAVRPRGIRRAARAARGSTGTAIGAARRRSSRRVVVAAGETTAATRALTVSPPIRAVGGASGGETGISGLPVEVPDPGAAVGAGGDQGAGDGGERQPQDEGRVGQRADGLASAQVPHADGAVPAPREEEWAAAAKVRPVISPSWPARTRSVRRVRASHARTVPSSPPVATWRPSAWSATAVTLPS